MGILLSVDDLDAALNNRRPDGDTSPSGAVGTRARSTHHPMSRENFSEASSIGEQTNIDGLPGGDRRRAHYPDTGYRSVCVWPLV